MPAARRRVSAIRRSYITSTKDARIGSNTDAASASQPCFPTPNSAPERVQPQAQVSFTGVHLLELGVTGIDALQRRHCHQPATVSDTEGGARRADRRRRQPGRNDGRRTGLVGDDCERICSETTWPDAPGRFSVRQAGPRCRTEFRLLLSDICRWRADLSKGYPFVTPPDLTATTSTTGPIAPLAVRLARCHRS